MNVYSYICVLLIGPPADAQIEDGVECLLIVPTKGYAHCTMLGFEETLILSDISSLYIRMLENMYLFTKKSVIKLKYKSNARANISKRNKMNNKFLICW